jgi:hypothetical protein
MNVAEGKLDSVDDIAAVLATATNRVNDLGQLPRSASPPA